MTGIAASSLQGFLLTSFDDLHQTFGAPGDPADADKSHVEWRIGTPTGPVAVYDYGDCHDCAPCCVRDPRHQPQLLTEWHLGTSERSGADWLISALADGARLFGAGPGWC